jgi:hypothetical protein
MKRRRRTKRNPSQAIATLGAVAGSTASVVGAVAPVLPWVALAGVAYWAWRKFLATSIGAGAAHAASAVPAAYGQAAQTAMDPSAWRPTYRAAEQWWQGEGEEGNPIAQPYYGPAGQW